MICCINCFKDIELRAAIESLGHRGNCQICKSRNIWIYDSDNDCDKTDVGEMLEDIIEIYVEEKNLPLFYPDDNKGKIEEKLLQDWDIFSGDSKSVKKIIEGIINNSTKLDSSLLNGLVGIPQLMDQDYLKHNSIMGEYNWEIFKKYLRNENRFHSKYINLEVLKDIIQRAEIKIPAKSKFYRSRISNDNKKFDRKDLGAPPKDRATVGRANSKGQSCLYLCNKKDTTVKEIRAHAFDLIATATFESKRDVRIVDLCSLVYNSPFYVADKVSYLLNHQTLKQIQADLAKPLSRYDSDLDYLPTQYISDYAKFLGYDGVKYYSTFDESAFNLAIFDLNSFKCIYHRNYIIRKLDYELDII